MKIFRYYCSSNSNHLVQIENWTRCDVWTIFSPRCTNTLWISNFHWNCICIFNSMKIYQILLQLRLKVFSSNWKLNLLWCMDNIQYTFYKYTLSLKFSLILYLHDSLQWRFFRYFCSSNSNHLVQIENWIYCDVWTIFSTHFSNTHWISSFYCNCIYIFNSMKIYQILLQLQLKLFSSNRKLNLLWCMDNIQYTFYKHTLSLKFSLILYLHVSFQWRFFRYYCSSNSNHLVQIENWTRCDVWTIFSPRFTNTLCISNFHSNCIYIINLNLSFILM